MLTSGETQVLDPKVPGMKPAGEGITHTSLFRGILLVHEPFPEVSALKKVQYHHRAELKNFRSL